MALEQMTKTSQSSPLDHILLGEVSEKAEKIVNLNRQFFPKISDFLGERNLEKYKQELLQMIKSGKIREISESEGEERSNLRIEYETGELYFCNIEKVRYEKRSSVGEVVETGYSCHFSFQYRDGDRRVKKKRGGSFPESVEI